VTETSLPNGALAQDKRAPDSGSASRAEIAEKVASFQPITASRAPAPATQALVQRGDTWFGTGDITSARRFYEQAADAGDGQAALRLGESYDPAFLQQAHLRAIRGDPAVAVKWYKRARELGAREADILLRRIELK
jgi:TPR repeat protein